MTGPIPRAPAARGSAERAKRMKDSIVITLISGNITRPRCQLCLWSVVVAREELYKAAMTCAGRPQNTQRLSRAYSTSYPKMGSM